MSGNSARLAAALILGIAMHAAHADDNIAPDQPGFAPDQPGLAMSSLTVGSARVELETSVERDVQSGVYTSWSTPTLLRIGIGDSWEARVSSVGYAAADFPGSVHASGWNDTAVGFKYHLPASGTDGAASMGVLLNVILPSGADVFRGHGARPSVQWTTEWSLPNGYSLGLMPGVTYDNAGNGRFVSALGAVSVGKDVTENAHVFAELAAPRIAATSNGGTQLSLNTGATYRLAKDTQLDVGLYSGLNNRTPDFILTIGFSQRW